MDTSHAIDYATNAFVKGTIKKPYIRAAATRAATGTTPNATTARHAALAGAGSPLPSPADRLAALGPEWERRFRFSPEAIQSLAKELMEHFTEYITAKDVRKAYVEACENDSRRFIYLFFQELTQEEISNPTGTAMEMDAWLR